MYKKILAATLSTAMAFALIGCGSSSSSDDGEVELGEYTGLVVYEDDVEVTDDDYQSTVDYLLSQDETTETVTKGKVKKDSVVNVDYVGKIKVDGKKVKFDGGSAESQSIDMSSDADSYIDGFVSSLKGHKVGETFTVKLQFPDSYTGTTEIDGETIELAGQNVWFKFTVNSLSVTTTPELTDEWAAENYGSYGVTDITSFEEYVRRQMYVSNVLDKVWDDFVDTCEVVSYNQEEQESLAEVYEANFESQLQSYYSVDLQTYLEACSMSDEDWEDQVTEEVQAELKEEMIMWAIAEAEGLVPEGDDYEAEAATLAEQNSLSVDELESTYGKDQVEYAIIYQKVREFITDNAEVKEGSEPTTAEEDTEAETSEDETAAEETDAE